MAYLSKINKVDYTKLSQKFIGNIISNDWYEKFTNSWGTPDLPLISILSEIVYWYRPKRIKDTQTGNITYVNKFLGDAWQTSYEHFEKKFGFNREKLRRIFVKLEQMGICSREFRNVKLRGQTYNNRLFIHLSSQFLSSYTDNKNFAELKTQKNHVKPEFSAPKSEGGSPHFRGDHLIDKENKNNIFKNRSTECESNFLENSFEEEKILQLPTDSICNKNQESSGDRTNQIKSTFAKALKLKDFYPLTEEDCQKLQSNSGREFSLHAMNEILLDMSKRVTNRFFKSKKGFINYMSKAFSYEMRDAVKVSNENFKIRTNQSKEEKEAIQQEEYLAKIEYNLEVSSEWHFKKRLASVLTRNTAYNLLKAYKNVDIKEGIFNVNLSKYVELTDAEKKIILSQAKSTHEQSRVTEGRQGLILGLKVIMPEKNNTSEHIDQNETETLNTKPITLPVGIWGRVRQGLVEAYGEATDRNWFSRLTANIDEERREIKLKAATNFIKDWIENNYLHSIEKILNNEQFKVSFY